MFPKPQKKKQKPQNLEGKPVTLRYKDSFEEGMDILQPWRSLEETKNFH